MGRVHGIYHPFVNNTQTIHKKSTMIESIISLFAVCELSTASRRLLQAGGAGNGVFIPSVSLPGGPGGATLELLCVTPYTEPGSCAGGVHGMGNPPNKFKMECSALGACASAVFNFEYGTGSSVEHLEGIWFTEEYAGYKTTLNLVNNQPGQVLKLDRVEFSAPGACQDLNVQLTNVDIGDFVCTAGLAGVCQGCTITDNSVVPAYTTPCHLY